MDKNQLFRKAIALVLSSITISSSGMSLLNIFKEDPERLSKGIYDGLFLDDEIKHKYYSLNNIPMIHCTENFNEYVDLSVNLDKLESIKHITIDAHNCDFLDLLFLKSLDTVSLYNINCITDEDIEIISKLDNIKNIILLLDFDYLNENNSNKFIKLKNKNIILKKKDNIETDLYDMYIYKYFLEFRKNSLSNISLFDIDEKRIKKLIKWDNDLNSIIESFNIDENTDEVSKLIKIIEYVTNTLDYDPAIFEQINSVDENIDIDMVNYYNKDILKCILDDKSKYGICCNFASLTSILSKYLGIPISYKVGTYGDGTNNSHAWCFYETYNEIIDPTLIDKNNIYNIQKENYYKNSLYMSKSIINYEILNNILENTLEELYLSSDDNLKEGKKILNINSNKDIFTENIMLQTKISILISFISSLLLMKNFKKIRNENKKQKIKFKA